MRDGGLVGGLDYALVGVDYHALDLKLMADTFDTDARAEHEGLWLLLDSCIDEVARCGYSDSEAGGSDSDTDSVDSRGGRDHQGNPPGMLGGYECVYDGAALYCKETGIAVPPLYRELFAAGSSMCCQTKLAMALSHVWRKRFPERLGWPHLGTPAYEAFVAWLERTREPDKGRRCTRARALWELGCPGYKDLWDQPPPQPPQPQS